MGNYNASLGEELRGTWNWSAVEKWELHLREREIKLPQSANGTWVDSLNVTRPASMLEDWSWVSGSVSFTARPSPEASTEVIDYELSGLHSVATGEYIMLSVADGRPLDIRDVPILVDSGRMRHFVEQIVVLEAERRIQRVRESKLPLGGGGVDDVEYEPPQTACSLWLHLRSNPLDGYTRDDLEAWQKEQTDPQGLSLKKPPPLKLAGVALSTGCGMAFELDEGHQVS